MPWTINEWCERWSISVPTVYDMQKRKVGPVLTELPGIRAKRITEKAETAWIALSTRLANSKTARRAADRRKKISSNAGRIAAEITASRQPPHRQAQDHAARAEAPGW